MHASAARATEYTSDRSGAAERGGSARAHAHEMRRPCAPPDSNVAAGRQHLGVVTLSTWCVWVMWRGPAAPAACCLAVGTEGFLCGLFPRSIGRLGSRGGCTWRRRSACSRGRADGLGYRSSSAISFCDLGDYGEQEQVRCLITRVGSVFAPECTTGT